MSQMKALPGCLAVLLAVAASAAAAEGAFAPRPIHYVVASAPGGLADVTARVLGPRLSMALHVPVVIENRTGGGIVAGGEAVAHAAPDGHTLLSATPQIAIVQSMVSDLSFHPRRDLAPVALIGMIPNVLMVSPRTPAATLADLVELARRNPGKLNYSSTGTGTSVHLTAELLKYYARVDILHVPYHGAAAAMTALMAGDVDMMVDALPPSLAQIRSGKVRALAITSAHRAPQLPDVPTMIESGYPELEVNGWSGVATTAGTPPETVALLSAEIERILALPEVAEAYSRIGMSIHYLDAARFSAFIDAEVGRFALAVKVSGASKN